MAQIIRYTSKLNGNLNNICNSILQIYIIREKNNHI